MNKELELKWEQADKTGEPILVGESVVCDCCNKDFTSMPDIGGFVFTSSAYGPCCAGKMMRTIERYNEQSLIRAHCPANMSFADFIRAYRGPDATIQITKGIQ